MQTFPKEQYKNLITAAVPTVMVHDVPVISQNPNLLLASRRIKKNPTIPNSGPHIFT